MIRNRIIDARNPLEVPVDHHVLHPDRENTVVHDREVCRRRRRRSDVLTVVHPLSR